MTSGNDKSLESWIWDAACSIRSAKDAPKFKDYIRTSRSGDVHTVAKLIFRTIPYLSSTSAQRVGASLSRPD